MVIRYFLGKSGKYFDTRFTSGYIHDVVGVSLLGQQGEAEGRDDEQRDPESLPRRQEEGQRDEEREQLDAPEGEEAADPELEGVHEAEGEVPGLEYQVEDGDAVVHLC